MRNARTTIPIMFAAMVLALFAPLATAIDTTQLPDESLQARYEALTHELRCVQCQNQSIADSPVGLASDLRREVRDLLVAGRSDDEIRDFMVARYGDFILFKPRLTARSAWLWGLPGVLLLIGGIVAWRIVRQRSAMLATQPDLDDEDLPRS